MRILTIVRNLGPGGTQRSAQSHAVGYRDAGHESAVLAYEAGGPREAELVSEGIEAFVCDDGAEGSERDAAVRRALEWAPDAVHIHRAGRENPATGELMRRFRAASARAIIETNHFARADRSEDRRLIDVHIQLSRWCLWQWRKRCRGLRPRPVGVAMPHIIRADRFARSTPDDRAGFRDEHGIPGNAILFGRVAQPLQPKWSPVLFHAFKRVAAVDPDAWLLVVGLPPADQKHIDSLPDDVRQRVRQIDFLHGDEALRRCYGAIDVFAHACRIGETFGMVICEAALCGVPTITLSTPLRDNSQLEVVGHERGGLVAGDTESFVQAMLAISKDPDHRARLATNAAKWVVEQCNAQRVTMSCLGLIEAALAASSPEDLRARVRSVEGVATDASTADLKRILAVAPGTLNLRSRISMELSTIRAIGDVKRFLVRMAGRS